MDQIHKQVARARGRLNLELYLKRLLVCWFVAFSLAAIALAVPKLVVIDGLPANFSSWCLWGALGIGIAAAVVWMLISRRSDLEAAMELDYRYGLSERVASSLSLPEESLQTPAGQALLHDAIRAVGRVDVEERFGIRLGRKAWLPLVPALLAFAVVMLFDNQQAESNVTARPAELTQQEKENLEKTRKRLEERRKKAAKAGLKDAEDLFRQLEKKSRELDDKKHPESRKKALVKLNDLAKQLEQRRDKIGGQKALQKQLNQLKDFQKGPADKLADAMKQGDWKAAKGELEKLRDKIKKGDLNEADKQQLEKQLQQMKKKLDQAAAAAEQQKEDLKKQIEQQKRQGNMAEAGRLQQKLDKMQQQQQQAQQMQKLAEQMANAQEAMKQGDAAKAGEAMDKMMQQMEQMQQQMAESEMLEAMMGDLQAAKNAMACESCQGEGCEACQGGDGEGEKPGNAKNATGKGPGGGSRPDEENDTNFRDTRVRQNVTRGAAVVTGEVNGPNRRGTVEEQLKEEMASQGSEPADPMVVEQLPKSRREHAEEYFNTLREGR